jgi:hypothetical protein
MNQMIHVRDEKSTGTAGDLYTGGSENTHTLNAVKTNTIPGASLASNQVTLPGGLYWLEGYASLNSQGRLSIYDATHGVYLVKGIPNPLTGAPGGPHVFVRGEVFLIEQAAIELRTHPTNNVVSPAVSYGSDPEVYAELVVRRIG